MGKFADRRGKRFAGCVRNSVFYLQRVIQVSSHRIVLKELVGRTRSDPFENRGFDDS
jgi:hypothetical protein